MILTINRRQVDPDIIILEMDGRIVLGNDAKAIEWKVDELLKEGCKNLIFDLTAVTVLDSTGVGILVMCYARLRKSGGMLHVAGAQGMVEQTLRMTNVDRLIELYPTVAAAASSFSSARAGSACRCGIRTSSRSWRSTRIRSRNSTSSSWSLLRAATCARS